MIVEQIWTGNAYRNFNYLIVCPETGDALAVDPLDFRKCLDVAAANDDDDGSSARLVAMLDNLGKGASGAAVQNLNLMLGLPEDAGLQ